MKLEVNQKIILKKMQKERSDVDDGGTFCLFGAGSYSDSVPRKCGSDAPSAWYWPVINEPMEFYGGILVPAAIRIIRWGLSNYFGYISELFHFECSLYGYSYFRTHCKQFLYIVTCGQFYVAIHCVWTIIILYYAPTYHLYKASWRISRCYDKLFLIWLIQMAFPLYSLAVKELSLRY